MTALLKTTFPAGTMLLSLLVLNHPAQADQGTFSLSSGLDFSSGKYGGSKTTEVVYIPLTGKYENGDWLYKLTVPYIRITGPGNVTPNIGQAVYANNDVRTDDGLGDVVATATHSLLNSGSRGLVIDMTGKVKFGTADKYKGLGSGENDYAAETSAYKIFGRFSAFCTLGYKVFGQSPGYTLNNTFYGSLGISNKLDEQNSAGLIYDYRQPTASWSDPQKEWTVFLNKKINKQQKIQIYFFTGLGIASPDFGGGTMLTETF